MHFLNLKIFFFETTEFWGLKALRDMQKLWEIGFEIQKVGVKTSQFFRK